MKDILTAAKNFVNSNDGDAQYEVYGNVHILRFSFRDFLGTFTWWSDIPSLNLECLKVSSESDLMMKEYFKLSQERLSLLLENALSEIGIDI